MSHITLDNLFTYVLVTARSSGILKAKQKLGRTFNSDKLGGIAFTKISELTICTYEEAQAIVPASTSTAHAQF